MCGACLVAVTLHRPSLAFSQMDRVKESNGVAVKYLSDVCDDQVLNVCPCIFSLCSGVDTRLISKSINGDWQMVCSM